MSCRQARWIRRLVGGRHGEALAAEIEVEYRSRLAIEPGLRRRMALLGLWTEISPRLLLFAAQRLVGRPRASTPTEGALATLWDVLRHSFRSLRRRPGFTAVVVATLALGIGANTAIFSAVHGVLLQPLPHRDPDGLLTVNVAPRGPDRGPGSMSYHDLADLEAESPSIERLIGFSSTPQTLTGRGEPALLNVTRVTDGLFDMFRVAPLIGRDIRPDEFGPDAPAIVVVGHGLWLQRFAGDPGIIGESLVLNGVARQIVGVAPPGFDFPDGTQLWVPRRIDLEGCARGCHTWQTIGRLAAGATLVAARSEADALAANLSEAYPETNLDKQFLVRSLRDVVVGEVQAGLWLLLGAVGALLLIACANVANLMLARAATRRGEMALRAALGATPVRLASALLMESVMLAMLGGAVGLIVARGGVEVLRQLSAGTLPRVEMIAIDGTVMLFTFSVAVAVALLFGLSPALRVARLSLSATLGAAGRGSDAGTGGRTLRSALTAAEMCLSVVLLIAAGLLLRTFFQLHAVDPGFETREMLRFSISLPSARYPELEQLRTTFRGLETGIAALRGVESVGSVYAAPLQPFRTSGGVIIEGEEPPEPGRENGAAIRPVSPGYLETARIPLLAGRGLDAADDSGTRDVAVVNQAFVRDNFPDSDPLGRRVRITVDLGFGSPFWTIVGVVGDVRSDTLTRQPRPAIYVPHGRFGGGYMTVTVRGVAGAGNLVDAIRAEVRAADPDVPVQRVETIREVVDRAVAPTRFFLVGVSLFAGTALLLAGVGLYGVIAYLASRRAREIGVRMALGASRSRIVAMVMADGLRPAAAGLIAGVVLALAGGRMIESLLYGVPAHDPLILVAVTAVLLLVAVLAIVVPAMRASRLDPLRTLRAD